MDGAQLFAYSVKCRVVGSIMSHILYISTIAANFIQHSSIVILTVLLENMTPNITETVVRPVAGPVLCVRGQSGWRLWRPEQWSLVASATQQQLVPALSSVRS